MLLNTLALVLVPTLAAWLLASAARWYRPSGTARRRAAYAAVTRQLCCLASGLLIPVGAVVVFQGVQHGSTPFALASSLLLGALPFAGLLLFTLECLTRVVEYDSRELSARSIWGRRVTIAWSELAHIEYRPWLQSFVLRGADGRSFAAPAALVGLRELLEQVVLRRPIGVYFGARSKLDAAIPRLECELQGAVSRLYSRGLAGLDAPDDVVAPLAAALACILGRGLHAFYMSPVGELGRVLPALLSRLGAEPAAGILSEANALFGHDGPPLDHAERERMLEKGAGVWWQRLRHLDERLGEVKVELVRLLRDYIDTHAVRAAAVQPLGPERR